MKRCGDSAQKFPVIEKIAVESDNISTLCAALEQMEREIPGRVRRVLLISKPFEEIV